MPLLPDRRKVIVSELAKRQREIQQAMQERDLFEQRIKDMEVGRFEMRSSFTQSRQASMLSGGQKVEESEEFQEAVMRERGRIRREQEACRWRRSMLGQ